MMNHQFKYLNDDVHLTGDQSMSNIRYVLLISILVGCSLEKEKNKVNRTEITEESLDAVTDLEADILVSSFATAPTATVVENEDSLPDCTEQNQGQMVFVKDIKSFKYCDSSWVDIDLKGEKGEQGESGTQGEKGDQGDKGEGGEQGIQGEKGDQGDQGEQGIQGEKGDQGDQGEQGIQGEMGEQGEKGDQGEQGIQGEKGDQGEQGIQGEMGEKGEKGDQGIQGEKGDTGDQGGLLVAKLECPSASADLDDSSQFDIYGDGATIYQFSDGSYQMVTYSYFEEYALDGSFIDSDVSTTIDRFAPEELISGNILQLQDLSLVFRYNVTNKTITYMNLKDYASSSRNPQETIVQCDVVL